MKIKGKSNGAPPRWERYVLKYGKEQSSKIRKGIVQKYTASVQQIGRTLRDKGEKVEGSVLKR